jgi:hypothetical protein
VTSTPDVAVVMPPGGLAIQTIHRLADGLADYGELMAWIAEQKLEMGGHGRNTRLTRQ